MSRQFTSDHRVIVTSDTALAILFSNAQSQPDKDCLYVAPDDEHAKQIAWREAQLTYPNATFDESHYSATLPNGSKVWFVRSHTPKTLAHFHVAVKNGLIEPPTAEANQSQGDHRVIVTSDEITEQVGKRAANWFSVDNDALNLRLRDKMQVALTTIFSNAQSEPGKHFVYESNNENWLHGLAFVDAKAMFPYATFNKWWKNATLPNGSTVWLDYSRAPYYLGRVHLIVYDN